jgi:hypothetical protein
LTLFSSKNIIKKKIHFNILIYLFFKKKKYFIFIRYLYGGFTSIEGIIDKYIIDVIAAANELELKQLFNAIEEYIIKNKTALFSEISEGRLKINPFQIIGYRDHFEKLHDFTLELICRNPIKYFQTKEFLEIKEDSLIYLLERDDLEMEEIDIWEYLVKWGIANQKLADKDLSTWTSDDFMILERAIHNCIPLIRFFQIPYKEYHSKIRKHFKKLIPETLDDELLDSYLYPNMKVKTLPPRISAFPFDSKIINAKEAARIYNWIDRKDDKKQYIFNQVPCEFKLLLRGSRDGFGLDVFHKLCENKGPTIIVAKVRDTNKIIGGYNPLWKSQIFKNKKIRNYYARNSFIFSLTDRANPILSRILTDHINNAIIIDRQKGVSFGESDLWLGGYQWRCQQKSYEHKIIEQEYFDIEDYEVFQVIESYTATTFITFGIVSILLINHAISGLIFIIENLFKHN